LAKARSEHELLAKKLALIESRLLIGGENMLEKAEEQARLLQKSQDELEKSRKNQHQLKKAIEERLAERVDMEERYSNLADEAAGKTAKLRKLVGLLAAANAEQADADSEHQREIEGLLDSVRMLRKELLLNLLFIENFIPPDALELIERFVSWNEQLGDWQLKCIAYTGNNMRARQPPTVMPPEDDPITDSSHLFLSYANELGSSVAVNNEIGPGFKPRLKSGKRERNAAQLRALLD